MKRRGLLIGLVGCLLFGLVVTQCAWAIGSTSTSAEPPCYKAFWPGQEIRFKLTVPAEYFFACPDCETVLITGWWVESFDGGVIFFYASFDDAPKGHWYVASWDQRDGWGNPVSPGYYKLVIQTTVGEFLDFVYIAPCNLCPCCCCPPGLYDLPCPIACEQPYIDFLPAEGNWCTYCSPLWISLFFGTDTTP
jgi:hypothetical protein